MTATSTSMPSPSETVGDRRLLFGLGIILSAASGVMLLLSFPPYGLWPLAWFAFAVCLVAQHRMLPRKWATLAPAVMSLFWLGPYLARIFGTEYGPVFTYLGVLIAIVNLFVATERKFHEATGYRWFILYGMVNWVGFEMIRATFIPVIATTAFIGYTQAPLPWLIQPVSIFSVYALNAVIILVNCALAHAAIGWIDGRWHLPEAVPVDGRGTRRWLTATGAVLAVWIGLSLIIFNSFPANLPKVRVASLRPNFPLPAHQDTVNTSQVRFETFVEQAQEAAAEGAQIIYTPELMFNFDPKQEYTDELRALADETGAYFFITYSVGKEGEPWRNESVLLTPDGSFSQVYGKFHTWMIGEPPTPSAGAFPVYDTPLGRLAAMICHDANYTDTARKLAANGAQLIAAPYREFGGFGEQAWNNALFRAVENRVGVVLSGVATVSAIINPDGSLVGLDTNIDGSRTVMVGDVTLGSGNAPYTSLGDILGWAFLAGYVFFMVFQSVSLKRAKKAA
jgi:apolipoprotein N-acyltransferase